MYISFSYKINVVMYFYLLWRDMRCLAPVKLCIYFQNGESERSREYVPNINPRMEQKASKSW